MADKSINNTKYIINAIRIYRIGQNTDVHIYNVLLNTGKELNLDTRMNDILNWSEDMFTNMIDGGEDRL